MTGLKEQQLFESFENKEYRDAFIEERISSGLAFQIRALRDKNGWSQEDLGKLTGKAQETISQLESHDYGSFTLKTLKTLASAFDLALMVDFVSFTELIARVSNLTPEIIAPPSYDEEKQMSFAGLTGDIIWPPINAAITYDTLPDDAQLSVGYDVAAMPAWSGLGTNAISVFVISSEQSNRMQGNLALQPMKWRALADSSSALPAKESAHAATT